MGADRCSLCPKCVGLDVLRRKKEEADLSNSYGKITQAEFVRRSVALSQKTEFKFTLREDFEIGLDGHDLYIKYSCSCSVCKAACEIDRVIEKPMEIGGPIIDAYNSMVF